MPELLRGSVRPSASHDDAVEILMVDDRPENLLALEAVLSSGAGTYRLIGKMSGEDALRYVMQSDLDKLALILMDVHLPGMDGYETAKLMRERRELRQVPIIFITAAYKSKSNVRQGYLNGSIDYLFKPFDPDILRWKVDNFVNLHHSRRELKQMNALLAERNREIELVNRRLLEAEQKLLQHQRLLEQVVDERTKQLREANQEIYRSNRRFRTVFYTNPNLIAIRRLVDGKYIDVNDAWQKTTGFCVQKMNDLGDDALRIRAKEDRDGTRQIEFKTSTGEKRHGLLSVQVLEVNDEQCELLVITDISDRVEMQNHLNRLERLNLIGEMAAGIAHEIRNPMTTIQGFLQIWRKTGTPLPKEHIDLMLSELLRANQIISEYLSLAGNKESRLAVQSVRNLVDTVAPLLQAVAVMAEKEIEVVHKDGDVEVLADENEMRQVILNLAKNGLEAMNEGGLLKIVTCLDGDSAMIDVEDQGPGIPEHVLEKLGTPFFTTKDRGTGLGLALCYSIVQRHNGSITVASSPRGTKFTIRLPVAGSLAAVGAGDDMGTGAQGGARRLVGAALAGRECGEPITAVRAAGASGGRRNQQTEG